MSTLINIPTPSTNPYTQIGGLFAQTGNGTPITATVVEATLIDGGVGGLSVPANAFQVGDSFIASMGGIVSCANNEGLTIRVKAGSIILGTTNSITMPQCTTQRWDLQVRFTIRALGAAGVGIIASFGQFTFSKDASNAYEGSNFSTINNTTFDTTISNTLDITAQWGSTNAANSIYSESFILTKIY